MKTIRNRDKNYSGCLKMCGVLYFGFYVRHGVKNYVIETNTPLWLRSISFYKSESKPDYLRVRLFLYSLLTLIAVPIATIYTIVYVVLIYLGYALFFNVVHNAQRPWWDDRLAGLQSLTITIYAIIISWLYFKN